MLEPRLRRAEDLFNDLAEAPPEERDRVLSALCAGDTELRALVERLLINDDSGMAGFLSWPILIPDRCAPHPPAQIGKYQIVREIGRGGAGVVYEARQSDPPRPVALKVIGVGLASPDLRRRFAREAAFLGHLQHPGIAQIYEVGVAELDSSLGGAASLPYFAMELVHGEPVTAYCDRERLTIAQRLRLFQDICSAVEHAHQKGIIHRDLKPSNVLVTKVGARPLPKVIDFGIAKATATHLLDGAQRTEVHQLIGTPEYMSPEQAELFTDLDTRSDVYSLGVLLYELLTGATPLDAARLRGASFLEIQRLIRTQEPLRPSLRVQAAPAPQPALARQLRGDLDWIVMKCLEKDRQHRYSTVSALCDDIGHYLDQQPVLASPPRAGYKLRKFVRRNRGAVIAGAVVTATLLIAAGVSLAFGLSEAAQRQAAELARDELRQVAEFQAAQLSGIEPRTMGVQLRTGLLEKARAATERLKLPPEAVGARAVELEELIAGSDFTGLALEALDDNFFQPALVAVDKQFADQPLVRARLLQTLASTLHELGLFDAASGPQMEALAIRRRLLGDEYPDTLASISNMGGLLRAQGKLAEAALHCREALDKCRVVLGDKHARTLDSINNLGRPLWDQGKLAEAEEYYREALEKRRQVLGDEHPDTLISTKKLGGVLTAQGKLAEAEPYCREAPGKSRRVLGDEHPDTLIALGNMASLLKMQGKLAEAETYCREALEESRRVLGDEHPDTLTLIGNLGGLLFAQGELAEAEPYFREALEKRRRLLGDEHPNTLNSISTMSSLLWTQGKLSEAEAYLHEALEKSRSVLGGEHPDTLTAINNMGVVLRAQGKLVDAEPYYREALKKSRRVLGGEHPDTLISIVNLAGLFQSQDRPAEAIALLAPAESAARLAFTSGNALHLGRLLSVLGCARVAAGEFDAAEDHLIEANAIIWEAKGAMDRDRSNILTGFVELYDAWDKPDQAAAYRQLRAQVVAEGARPAAK